jgi:hypothetical protein
VGSITTTVTVAGIFFAKAPSFFVGALTTSNQVAGVLFATSPSFFLGTITQTGGGQVLSGVLFSEAPTFFLGVITQIGVAIASPLSATIRDASRWAAIRAADSKASVS